MSVKILCVDDEPNILSGYQRSLRKQFEIETAPGGSEALEKMEASGPYAVIVTDMRMPGMDGIQFLKAAQEMDPDSVRIMLTGNADQQTAADAVNEGHIFRFLNKPCTPEDLAQALTAGLKQYRLITAEKELLEKTLGGTIKVLMEILATVDPELFGRAQTLRRNMHTLADALRRNGQLAREDLWPLELASLLAQRRYGHGARLHRGQGATKAALDRGRDQTLVAAFRGRLHAASPYPAPGAGRPDRPLSAQAFRRRRAPHRSNLRRTNPAGCADAESAAGPGGHRSKAHHAPWRARTHAAAGEPL